MSDLIPFSFENHSIRVLTDDNGEPLFVAKDVATALGYADTTNAIKQHCKGVAEHHPLQTKGGLQQARVIREPDLYRLMANSQLPSAQAFERLVFEEILPTIRKTGQYESPVAKGKRAPSQLAAKMAIARAAKSMLRMSETSTIRMLAKIAESEGLPTDFLPAYVNESLTRALTNMLKDLDHPLASKVRSIVHPAFEAMGILEHASRPSGSKPGEVRRFWSLTDEGLKYGRNETSPSNPRETIPLYFVDKFGELLERLEAFLSEHPNPAKLSVIKSTQTDQPGGAA